MFIIHDISIFLVYENKDMTGCQSASLRLFSNNVSLKREERNFKQQW